MKPPSLKWREEGCRIVMIATALTALSLVFPFGSAQYGDYPDLAGDYCRTRTGGNICCDGRLDTCSKPILGTLCYCDQFCNRTGNPDCCPDYWNVCLGITRPKPPIGYAACNYNGLTIPQGKHVMDNCNRCTCKNAKMQCTKHLCMIDEQLINQINSNNRRFGWTASNYSQFWGKTMDDGLMKLTGTMTPDWQSLRMHPIRLRYDKATLPQNFDARKKWREVGKVRDQGWCASSWAFSTVGVAEDRLTIASNGTEVVNLSTQNMLSCNRRGQKACSGGHVERAWNYFRRVGVITEECYPYVSGHTGTSPKCKIDRHTTLQYLDCERKEFPKGRTQRYTTEPAYRIASKEGDIMWEILNNGPIQALMTVYPDFFLYKNGVYSTTNIHSGQSSNHSVRVIGWGVESTYYGPPIKYWLATNSWGENWGESGTFKIRRGTNEAGIEDFILAVRTHLHENVRNSVRTRRHRAARRNRLSRSF